LFLSIRQADRFAENRTQTTKHWLSITQISAVTPEEKSWDIIEPFPWPREMPLTGTWKARFLQNSRLVMWHEQLSQKIIEDFP
jgi:hypothetical protein